MRWHKGKKIIVCQQYVSCTATLKPTHALSISSNRTHAPWVGSRAWHVVHVREDIPPVGQEHSRSDTKKKKVSVAREV